VNVRLRPARSTDAGRTGDILWQFIDESPWMPTLYTNAETIGFCGRMIDRDWVTVALLDEVVQGFIAREGEVINALYIARSANRRGLGRMLLDDAKTRVARLRLWTFQANGSARQFYLREGFFEAGLGDGSGNDENLPDVRYVWPRKAGKT
jgi:GNAT superfamily N-acetyltransferase